MSRLERERPARSSEPRVDTVVVGAGIIGLAVARCVLRRRRGTTVVVVDKEASVGSHQTSHNSGVIHSGVYYRPGSHKARLCVEGAAQMVEYCRSEGLPIRASGKLIVATEPRQVDQLNELERRARANGVSGVRRLRAADIKTLEPQATGIAGLHVPSTAVVDFRAVAESLEHDVLTYGGRIHLGFQVRSVVRDRSGAAVHGQDGETLRAGRVVVCAGLQSDRLAFSRSDQASLSIVPFRGSYFELSPQAATLVQSMVYPVPDPRFPFLGVHFTRHVDGVVSCGPNAVLALARERYTRWAVDRRDAWQTVRFPGTWRLVRNYWLDGTRELLNDLSARRFLRQARRYIPALDERDLRSSHLGVRAQAVDRQGRLVDDFAFLSDGPVLHVVNAPSPAATASLAIADHIVDRVGLH